jgi:hypothetical protein
MFYLVVFYYKEVVTDPFNCLYPEGGRGQQAFFPFLET